MSGNTCQLHPCCHNELVYAACTHPRHQCRSREKQRGTHHKHSWPPAICYLPKRGGADNDLFLPSSPPWLTCSHSGDVMVVGHGERNPLWVLTCRAGPQGAVQREGVAGCQSRESQASRAPSVYNESAAIYK